MNRTITIFSVILVFIIGALVGFLGAKACREPGMKEFQKCGLPPFFPGHNIAGYGACEKIIKYLDLTADQKKKVDDMLAKNRDERKKMVDSLREGQEKLGTLISAKEFDEAAFRKAFQHVSSIKENLAVLRAKMIPELKAVLTPEQIGYLKGRIDTQREFCKKGREHLRWGHPRPWDESDIPQPHHEKLEEPNS